MLVSTNYDPDTINTSGLSQQISTTGASNITIANMLTIVGDFYQST